MGRLMQEPAQIVATCLIATAPEGDVILHICGIAEAVP